jgi:hypothetical protein
MRLSSSTSPARRRSPLAPPPFFKQEAFHAEFAAEYVHRNGKIEFRLTGNEVQNAFAAQASQVCVRNVFRKYDHDQVAANLFD